nr:type IIL restriction-modification enzyme MmeI [Nitrosomonas ureae]
MAQVALWLTDHQMNALVSEEFGQYFIRLPLNKSAHIVHGNALQLDWNSVIPATQCHYVMGNPPFIGKTYLNDTQRIDVAAIFHDTKNAGLLDYVACWYRKATDYITAHPAIRAAFVSTNSITQGEQVGVLWPDLLRRGVHIHYAHRTFQWMSEAKGKAAVHCVIIGFGLQEATHKTIFEYADIQGESHAITAKNINPYLVDASDVVLDNRTNPICDVPEMLYGNKPVDGGNLLLSSEEKTELLSKEPKAEKWLRPLLGAEEFINGKKRWCLWLVGISPNELRAMPEVMKRVEAVRVFRLKSTKAQTRQHAVTATLFVENRQPENNYILVPRVSSERRLFVPIGFLDCHTISTDLNNMLPNATLYHFGILTSTMHNAWMRTVCGRLKSDYRYSVGIVYNNFPWPEILPNPPLAKGGSVQRGGISAIETAAQAVLDARAQFPDATLADLYDPLAMPPELVRAHQALDRAVDAAYGKKSFASEAERVAFLFERYQAITSLLPANATKKSRNSRH